MRTEVVLKGTYYFTIWLKFTVHNYITHKKSLYFKKKKNTILNPSTYEKNISL